MAGLLPLEGRVVGVTADRRADEQVELLQRKGAAVLVGPTMHTRPLVHTDELIDATRRVVADPPDFVVATTGIGVRSWLAVAETAGLDAELTSALGRARILARGPKVAGALHQFGLPWWRQEPTERVADMVRAFLSDPSIAGAKVVLQESGSPTPWVVEALSEAGAEVTTVAVYRWTLPDDEAPAHQLIDAIVGSRLDAVTFTSPPALRNLFALAEHTAGAEQVRRALNRIVVAAVGPVTAEAVAAAGVRSCVAPERGRLGLMVRTLADRLAAAHPGLAMAGTDVVIQGSVVSQGSVRIELSPRERAVLDVLVGQRGAVVPRSALLRDVWGGEPGEPVDSKLVDTTVSRLRRRLAPTGIAIQTVVRRGYRIDAEFTALT